MVLDKCAIERIVKNATDRLVDIRKAAGFEQKDFAERFGVNPTTYNRYESGEIKNMPRDLIGEICEAYSINPAYLMGYDNVEKYVSAEIGKPIKRIPIVGIIAAGQPLLVNEEVQGYEHVFEESGIDFCLKIKGDSMMNARIYDGDIVYIRKQNDVDNGEIAAVIIDGEEATLKRIFKINGSIILHAENPKYEDKIYSKKDAKQILIVGKAISVKFSVV